MDINLKANFLAGCLLESLEDENLRACEIFLEKNACDPNTIVHGRGIAPIHYACGMENIQIAERIVELMLKHGGDPNVQSEDKMTPLHVACLTGHAKIVKMLLQHDGDIHAMDIDRKTPVLYAVQECHFDVIETIQNFVFELKFTEKKKKLMTTSTSTNYQLSPRNKNIASVQDLDDIRLTPNRIHYNFDATSPYYIYITHRRDSSKPQMVRLSEMSPASKDENMDEKQNLFKLTEENVEKLSGQLSPEKSRHSLIQLWRQKVQRTRERSSILKVFNDIDDLLDGVMTEETLNFTNTLIDPKAKEADNQPAPRNRRLNNFLEKLVASDVQTDLSFVTAEEAMADDARSVNESNFIRSPKIGQIVMQVAEVYTHTDDEEGLVFYETRIHSNPADECADLNRSKSSLSSAYTVPADYDTDALRAELTKFGDIPGPITKSTKRLYTKRLIKYKRSTDVVNAISRQTPEIQFSVELEKTVQREDFFEKIQDQMHLERELSDHFHANGQKRKFREGNLKKSFIYLLIDPRISRNLPGEHKFLSKHEVWKIFLNAIFYVGKGKSSRPYSHLYDAMKIFTKNRDFANLEEHLRKEHDGPISRSHEISVNRLTESKKLQKILDIWRSQRGVCCLHIFHNIMPAEAYTREAAIIDALSLNHLTNLKRGDYYGPCQSWTMRNKKYLGIALLYKAMQIFLAEGESQLTPSDLM